MDEKRRQKGVELFGEVYCHALGPVPPPGESAFYDYMLETLFGTLWADETLSIRDRRLLLIGAIAAMGETNTLTIQMRSAFKRGELTAAQLDAIGLFMTQYVGYPRASQMLGVIAQVKSEAQA
ncbi:MAG TPA: carboxymuconolactone decarboxylase family protein [Nevskiaceae bacterium]|nr:carboxymuconolactone decarboxylase family protein [Nevskiaceae bacterium]